jgi:hypothetical protein
MSGYNFLGVFTKHQVANLTPCVDRVQGLQQVSVPESDVTICSASTCREEPALVRTPANSLDSCCVVMELNKGLL